MQVENSIHSSQLDIVVDGGLLPDSLAERLGRLPGPILRSKILQAAIVRSRVEPPLRDPISDAGLRNPLEIVMVAGPAVVAAIAASNATHIQ